jgi:hypothetical protein
MEFVVVIHADSPIGAFLLSMKDKIGGASGTMDVQGKTHPFIFATDLSWDAIGVLQMTHLQDPGLSADPKPRRIAIPIAAVLVALEKAVVDPPPASQQLPSVSLH